MLYLYFNGAKNPQMYAALLAKMYYSYIYLHLNILQINNSEA